MEQYQKLMIGHASLVMVVALLAGFMLAFGLIGGIEIMPGTVLPMPYYGTVDGWVRAHTGGLVNGLLMLGLALALPQIGLGEKMRGRVAYGIIFVGWANTIFYWFGNAAGNRALSFGDNAQGASNLFGMVGYGIAITAAILLLYILLTIANKLLRG